MSSEARFRPKPVEGDIPEYDLPYVALFGDLDEVAEESGDAERVILLLSTCRNVWMTINAVFVDVREVVGYSELYDRFSQMLFVLGRGEGNAAMATRKEINMTLGQVDKKVQVWGARHELMERLEEAIDARDGLSRSRLHHFLARQREHRATNHAAHGQYLALDLETVPAKSEELLSCLVGSQTRLLAISEVARVLAPLSTALGPLFDGERDGGAQGTIFEEEPEALGRSVRAAAAEAWPSVREELSKAAELVPEFTEVAEHVVAVDGGEFDVERAQLEFSDLLAAARKAVGREQEKLAEEFTENVSIAPMPAPFQIDLSRVNSDGKAHGKHFEIVTQLGNADQERDSARIGLLSCGLPESAYSHVNPSDYVYDDQAEARSQVIDAARRAIETAAGAGCVLLAMPEVFLPRAYMEEIARSSGDVGMALVAGVEYRQGRDHQKAINELIVALPGVRGLMQPRKQRPSVYEVREQDFEDDEKLWFFKHTAVGNLGVIVCSDYLELDVMSELAGVPERLDTLIVCSRNPAPAVFETLAKADAARLYASVVVVNARPDRGEGEERKPSSGEGTLVAVPTHTGLLSPYGEEIALEGPWNDDQRPALALFDLPLAKIRARDRRRPDDGFLPPPFYTRKLGE